MNVDIQAKLREFQQTYQAALPKKMLEIQNHWEFLRTDKWDWEVVDKIARIAHSLSGSGATFGFAQLSQAARDLEYTLSTWRDSASIPNDTQFAEVTNKINHLDSCSILGPEKPQASVLTNSTLSAKELHSVVFLLEDDLVYAKSIEWQLHHFGYEVKSFSDTQTLSDALKIQCPNALVADVMLPEGDLAGIDVLRKVKDTLTDDTPIIVCSSRNDFEARLGAVKAGASAYFVKPVDTEQIVESLDTLTQRIPDYPFRILIIEDDELLANHYKTVLESSGMSIQVLTQPEKIFEVLNDYSPDLLVVDMYMPRCTGQELAKSIRLNQRYVSTPIIYLSAETNIEKHMDAMRMGGDAFLTKPIDDDYLINAISIRATRARALTNLMMQDSLTGLLKHAKIKEQLAVELSRAARTGKPMTFAMLDVDHFKKINDQYGHMTGDRVLKSLANVLKKRLRLVDSIGRYGGEEFAIILANCNAEQGVHVIDQIREDFSKIEFGFEDLVFQVTFSVGMAGYPQITTAEQINLAADQALYQAKESGRNRVVAYQGDDNERHG